MKKLALIILDGIGINTKAPKENALTQGKTPNLDKLFKSDYASLLASGKAVGVPEDQMGNSEIGHMTIGSGRIIKQSIVEIDDMLDEGSFKKLAEFQAGITHCKKNNSNLHLLQIFGPGGVHGYDSHLKKILKIIPSDISVNLHLFTDGRDLAPQSAHKLMITFEKFLEKFPNIKIASLAGRYFGMDRDNNRDRIQKAYDEIFFGQIQTSDTPSEYIAKSYEKLINDEFIVPVCFTEGEQVEDGDAIFHLNFRSDRARQMTQAIMASIHPDDGKHTKRSK
jgi:2,3-bisphosphoglycerate-independent phosphoglycerate mutase